MPTLQRKIYLGDGAYAELGASELILTTENGIDVTNRIILGAYEWDTLVSFVHAHTVARKQADDDGER